MGRQGSRAHIYFEPRELVSRQLPLRWVNHGGSCMVHLPGQLAIYPIVPLDRRGMTVGEYMDRLQSALVDTMAELGVRPQTRSPQYGVWGRSGQLACLNVAVKNWTTYHGALINVCPAMELFRWVRTDPLGRSRMTSLTVECQKPVRMARVREAVVRHVAAALGCDRHHLYTGHPLLPSLPSLHTPSSQLAARVG
ncbi:MAG: hypothetical protein IIA67_12515 [Planctomycetes bacterium]|nr:hypothetical protein [Planctomycetota bacterium]